MLKSTVRQPSRGTCFFLHLHVGVTQCHPHTQYIYRSHSILKNPTSRIPHRASVPDGTIIYFIPTQTGAGPSPGYVRAVGRRLHQPAPQDVQAWQVRPIFWIRVHRHPSEPEPARVPVQVVPRTGSLEFHSGCLSRFVRTSRTATILCVAVNRGLILWNFFLDYGCRVVSTVGTVPAGTGYCAAVPDIAALQAEYSLLFLNIVEFVPRPKVTASGGVAHTVRRIFVVFLIRSENLMAQGPRLDGSRCMGSQGSITQDQQHLPGPTAARVQCRRLLMLSLNNKDMTIHQAINHSNWTLWCTSFCITNQQMVPMGRHQTKTKH